LLLVTVAEESVQPTEASWSQNISHNREHRKFFVIILADPFSDCFVNVHNFSSPYEVAANARETNQNRPSAQSATEAASLVNL
jgi:hypothetical protein